MVYRHHQSALNLSQESLQTTHQGKPPHSCALVYGIQEPPQMTVYVRMTLYGIPPPSLYYARISKEMCWGDTFVSRVAPRRDLQIFPIVGKCGIFAKFCA